MFDTLSAVFFKRPVYEGHVDNQKVSTPRFVKCQKPRGRERGREARRQGGKEARRQGMDGQGVATAREALDIVHAMATLLNTGLDRQTLAILIALCENGVNPEALAAVVKELRREAAVLKARSKSGADDQPKF